MGEEKKEESKGQVEEKEEQKDEKKEEESPEIVLKVRMHCEACARKIARALKGYEDMPQRSCFERLTGVEEVTADCKASKVVVKGKAADPIKVCQRLQKKSGRKVELISPLPKPKEEKKEENTEPKEVKKEEPPAAITVVLRVLMHCEACAQGIQRKIRKIQGVESVDTDVDNAKVTVKGVIDPSKLVDEVYKRTKKLATLLKDEEKKEEEKKEEEKKGEEKKEEKAEEKKGEENKGEEDKKADVKRSEYWPSKYYIEYAYPLQIFSDENPNACVVM